MFNWVLLLLLGFCSFHSLQSKKDAGGLFKRLESLLSALLFPTCGNSKEDEEELEALADEMKPHSNKFLRMVGDLDDTSKKLDKSIDRIIRDIEVGKINKAIEGANPKLLLIRNSMQTIADVLYKVVNVLKDSPTFNKILPAIKGIVNIHTTLMHFLTVKFFCFLESLINIPLDKLGGRKNDKKKRKSE